MPTWKKADPHAKDFYCISAWHLKKSSQCQALYSLIGSLTSGGQTPFFSSVAKLAHFFDFPYESTRKAFHVLRKLGWVEPTTQKGYFRFVPHKEWSKKHPDQCRIREELPWQTEVDPLVRKMYALSGGKLRMMPFQLAVLRKVANNDDARILKLFTAEIEAAKARQARGSYEGTTPNSCRYRVYIHLHGEWKRNLSVESPS